MSGLKVIDGRSRNGRTPRGLSPDQRFWSKVVGADVDTCWFWIASLRDESGYGAFYVDGQHVLAHRYAWQTLRGDIPDGLHLDHLCRNRACVNPWHMDPVTPLVNVRRSPIHNGAKTHCPDGHRYTEDNIARDRRGRRKCRICQRQSLRAWLEVSAEQDVASQEVRAWAVAEGFLISGRGRLPVPIVAAWNQAHPDRPYLTALLTAERVRRPVELAALGVPA